MQGRAWFEIDPDRPERLQADVPFDDPMEDGDRVRDVLGAFAREAHERVPAFGRERDVRAPPDRLVRGPERTRDVIPVQLHLSGGRNDEALDHQLVSISVRDQSHIISA